jgi:hypothetical protein
MMRQKSLQENAHGEPYRPSDPAHRSAKKKLFEEICAGQDLTPSQVVRKLVRQYIIDNAGNRELPDWLKPGGKSGD